MVAFYPQLPALPPVASGAPTLDHIHHTDALTLLEALPANSIDCVVTSPPYYALRDYGVDGQIGLEETPAAFIERLMQVFRQVYRVLKPSGTVWVNLGDSYANDTKWGGYTGGKHVTGLHGQSGIGRAKTSTGLPPKSLMMIPARFAIAMQDEGWILRSDIIWSKKAPMPESVTDRPTKSHEHIYLFAKEPQYFYDQEAVAEPAQDWGTRDRTNGKYHNPGTGMQPQGGLSGKVRMGGGGFSQAYAGAQLDHGGESERRPYITRNMRDVWHLSPEFSTAEHYAAYPTEIPRRCILAGCPEKVCCECGAPHERLIEKSGGTTGKSWHDHANDLERGMHQAAGGLDNRKSENGQPYTRIDRGLHPTCSCNAGTRAGVVLDFFMGTGTTAVMARKLGRHFIGGDLNPEYVAMARRRLAQTDPFLDRQITPELRQRSLFAMPG
jgi:DNA modification methylase